MQINIDQIQQEDVEYFNYLSNLIINDTKCTREIKCTFATANAAFNKKTLSTSKLDLNLRKTLVKCYTWSIALCGAETWSQRKSRSEIPGRAVEEKGGEDQLDRS